MARTESPYGAKMRTAIADGDDQRQAMLLTAHNPNNNLAALSVFLETHPEAAAFVQKANACSGRHPCHQRICGDCMILGLDKRETYRRFAREAQAKALSRNPQPRAAQLAQPLLIHSASELHYVTINFEAVQAGALKPAMERWRTKMKEFLTEFPDDTQALGRFEDLSLLAQDINPDHLSDYRSLDTFRPNEPAVKLHIHLLLYVPGADRVDIRAVFCERFGSGHVVDVCGIQSERTSDGVELKGVEGAARYPAKEHLSLNRLRGATVTDIVENVVGRLLVPRRTFLFAFNMPPSRDTEARSAGQWIQNRRLEYGLSDDFSKGDVERFLLDMNPLQLHHPENWEEEAYLQYLEDMAIEQSRDDSLYDNHDDDYTYLINEAPSVPEDIHFDDHHDRSKVMIHGAPSIRTPSSHKSQKSRDNTDQNHRLLGRIRSLTTAVLLWTTALLSRSRSMPPTDSRRPAQTEAAPRQPKPGRRTPDRYPTSARSPLRPHPFRPVPERPTDRSDVSGPCTRHVPLPWRYPPPDVHDAEPSRTH